MITDSIPTLHYKDLLELSILHLLDAGELSSTGLIEELTRRELLKTEGLVFPILAKLKNLGHITGRQVEENGPTTRKFYSITDTGREELHRLQAHWEKLVAQINDLIQRKSEL
jgi:PadR family transcriptional regulator PadR